MSLIQEITGLGRRPAGTRRAREVDRRRGAEVDARGLEAELRRRLEGEVRFDGGDRAMYATDAGNYRHVPIGVVIPRTIEDVVQTVAACRAFGAPIVNRGGGTSIGGQCVNVAVVMDFSKYLNRVLEIAPERRLARVQPGIVRDHLVKATAEHGLTFGPDTATHPWATIGGMLGNNSCGIHSVMAGRTADNVRELEILTYDGFRMRVGATSDEGLERIIRDGGRKGEIFRGLRNLRDRYARLVRDRFPDIPRRVSGYNLDELLPEKGFHVARALVGSESTCVTILEATLELVPDPPCRTLLVIGYPDVELAARHVPEVLEHRPIGLEGMDGNLVRDLMQHGLHPRKVELLPEGSSWLLVEFGGETQEEADEEARRAAEELERHGDVVSLAMLEDPDDQEDVWVLRESGLGATAFVPHKEDTWEGWEDAAVPPENLGDYLRDFRALLDRYDYYGALYGHFGDGCVHTRITFDLETAEGIETFRRFVDDAADLAVRYGGSLSGEHGDGQARSALLDKMYGPEILDAFREFKRIWDPDAQMNPGRIVDPDPITADLRLGTDYNPPRPETHFQFPDDHGDFARAALRCVGVGKCRKTDGGTMCPSYMVLREEMHTTRGRAHLLFEMLQGDPVRDGWRDEKVKESLDLCLSCKGCTGECPVNVDIPTYKAEFLSHYYAGRLRPRGAYAFGLIHWWARMASYAPRLVNFFARTPQFREVAKWSAEVAPERSIPEFATQTFRSWWQQRQAAGETLATGDPVILWADTFTNHFEPEVAKAAVEVLEDAGCRVIVPEAALCCGRPLYEFGFLQLAKRQLRRIIETLREPIRAGIPIVALEPSCTAVFRDELRNLFPHDNDADRLRQQVFTLYEYLHRVNYEPPRMRRKVLVHGHCHQKALLDPIRENELLQRMGLDVEVLDSGCCGMAGAFGYEKGERYEVSVGAGERVLLPAVRSADRDTLIMTDGFSCRGQIRQCTDREPLHLAQVIRVALHGRRARGTGPAPDAAATGGSRRSGLRRLAVAGAGLAAGGLLFARLRERIQP
jgi:FAD/FMN-containing dehydrogenase/Fe-S oxidoreductase